ncbi:hypothetical protein H6F93_31215 [Leptolyngbya sp. FACHB-671]|nr:MULTISPECIES: hypothetical protein [unclassified Leptolyngbya]MBD1995471.1 hypothetical protein [Leptolyngbya sp. FACHB-541]MBD2071939.1 hypothetical protein [Leptolyngbya sp. FACHB-671]
MKPGFALNSDFKFKGLERGVGAGGCDRIASSQCVIYLLLEALANL